MIRTLQPQCLITYKEGLLGTEDVSCREYKAPEKTDKPMEICDHLRKPGKQEGKLGMNADTRR